MPKPSIAQRVLNKPSQFYSPQTSTSNEYHSSIEFKSNCNCNAITSELPNYRLQFSQSDTVSDPLVHVPLLPTSHHYPLKDALFTLPSHSLTPQPISREKHKLIMDHSLSHSSPSSPSSSSQDVSNFANTTLPSPSTTSIHSTLSALASSTDYSRYSWCSDHSNKSIAADESLVVSEKQAHIDRSGSVHRRRRISIDIEQRRRRARSEPSLDDWAKDVRWLIPPSDIHRGYSMPNPVPSKRAEPANGPEPLTRYSNSRRSKSKRSRRGHDLSRSEEYLSALWEEDEDDEASTPSDSYLDHATPTEAPITVRVRTKSAPQIVSSLKAGQSLHIGDTDSSKSQVSDGSIPTSISVLRKVDLPVPLPVSDGGEPTGYTSLILPRAAPVEQKRYSLFFSRSTLDITRSGLAQTTMSTVSITKDASVAILLKSRKLPTLKRSSTSKLSPTPQHLLSTLPSPLSFTSHLTPPSRVLSNQVLVQVWAVGVDGLDKMIVLDKASRSSSFGFIPGRSFVGRAVECGYAVNSISKSDWVIGLLDARKCGALAEFIIVDKMRLARCNRPSKKLRLEQLALLPLCGIPAHRAVRTFGFPERGARALVLQAHDGAGALAVQELVSHGVTVTAQVSPGIEDDDNGSTASESLGIEDRVRRFGAGHVTINDPMTAVGLLEQNKFDLVIDTVGGRKIWDACRRVLHNTGQFTTLVGDYDQAIPTMNAIFRSNLRSLRRAFVKKDRKALSYAFISPVLDVDSEGEDIRKSLTTVLKLAEEEILQPWIGCRTVFPFEQSPNVLAASKNGQIRNARSAVIRIIDY